MTITEKLSKVVDFLVGNVTGDEDPDTFRWEENDGYDEPYEEELDGSAVRFRKPEYQTRVDNTRETKVVNHPNYKGHEVIIVEPRTFRESEKIIQNLKDKKTIVLNLQLLEKPLSQRIIDFVCGASKALSGDVKKVGENVFIFTPSSVALSVDSQAQSKFAESLWNK